ncbi:HNH endonuclease [Sphingobacterium faecale]|uniref:HNH endonuclease n=1 Tax=Sphingobacterium faecale TaxID=2803775 RepID=A0ABS1R769_9SPHI|nr:HNH endonuclease signature motif containing protein [Sphingobacterium faecale]MBL1410110.1 HNH endonuclease [Sphingobacterium faecale]
MFDTFIEMNFDHAYRFASSIRDTVLSNNPEEYFLDFLDLDLEGTVKPKKETILHVFISNHVSFQFEYYVKKGEREEVANEFESLFKSYKHKYRKSRRKDYEYLLYLEKEFNNNILQKIVNETFQLLFSDRLFCMEFNKLVSEYVSELKFVDNPKILSSDGKVIRCAYFQSWVQKAIFYRDKGCCAICLSDLSGLLKTDFHKAIDHIVPINLGGTNDITNFQLICRSCNSKKSGKVIKTSKYYSPFF